MVLCVSVSAQHWSEPSPVIGQRGHHSPAKGPKGATQSSHSLAHSNSQYCHHFKPLTARLLAQQQQRLLSVSPSLSPAPPHSRTAHNSPHSLLVLAHLSPPRCHLFHRCLCLPSPCLSLSTSHSHSLSVSAAPPQRPLLLLVRVPPLLCSSTSARTSPSLLLHFHTAIAYTFGAALPVFDFSSALRLSLVAAVFHACTSRCSGRA